MTAESDSGELFQLNEAQRPLHRDRLFDALLEAAEHDQALGMDESIRRCMNQGRELFGTNVMMMYTGNIGVTRHDAVYFMEGISDLYASSGLSAKQFSQQILLQVAKDGALYHELNAHQYFATVCNELKGEIFDPTVEGSVLHQLAQRRDALPELGQLVDFIQRDGAFASWKHLRAAYDACQLMTRQDLLWNIAKDPNARMRKYIGKLAFHPNISMVSVFAFWERPEQFFAISDEHAPHALQDVKKPSNYLTVSHLDWEASDLRDALVGRDSETHSAIDRLQTIPPMERQYTLHVHPENAVDVPENLHRFLLEALGNRKLKIEGRAKDSGKLFSALAPLLQQLGLAAKVHATTIIESPLGMAYLKDQRPDLYEALKEMIFHPLFGMAKPNENTAVFRVRIGWKSDPDMVVAGNDTASCMPFGSGKNNVYMCNPNCAQMVVERQTGPDTWTTAAQSVVTKNQEIDRPTPDLVKLFQSQFESIDTLLNAKDFSRSCYLACENVEVEKNAQASRANLVGEVYRRFWKEYLKTYADEIGVSNQKVVVGKGYSPSDLGFRDEVNNTIPLVPMSYSDNLHERHFVIETGLPENKIEKQPYVRPVTVTDVYSIAHLESKAFSDTGLGYGIHKVQNNLLGISIANEYFHRPSLSFIAQEQGKPAAAYLIAYEGALDGEKIVYVDDMAAEERGNPAGGRVLLAFVEAYMNGYREQPAFPPILADMRDQTSFRLVRNQLERLTRREGMVSKMIELGEWYSGGEQMHKAAIVIAPTEALLAERVIEMQTKLRNG